MAYNDNDNDDKTEQIMLDLFLKSLKTVRGGVIDIDMEGQSALRIEVNKEREKINIDFIHPTIIQEQKRKTKAR